MIQASKNRIPLVFGVTFLLSITFYFILRPISNSGLSNIVIRFILTGLFLGILPLYLVRALPLNLPRYYLPARIKLNTLIFLIFIIFIIIGAWIGSGRIEIQNEYPLWRNARYSSYKSFFLYEFSYFFYYLGWEGFFRGFVLFALLPWGKNKANLTQSILATLLHIGKPWPELLGAFPFSFALGLIALKTRSSYSPLFLHFLLGFFTDFFIRLR